MGIKVERKIVGYAVAKPEEAPPKATVTELAAAKKEDSNIVRMTEKVDRPEGAQLCPKCTTVAAIMMDGCMTCLSCADSRCG